MKSLVSPYLGYARLKRYSTAPTQTIKATDVLYAKMVAYHGKGQEILQYLIAQLKTSEKAQYDKIKQLTQQMKAFDDLAVDCAHKLAPYQTPKLESIEVKSKVEHRYVMRAPQQMKSAEEWMKATGAEKVTPQEQIKQEVKREIVKSVHDFDDGIEEQEYNEPGIVH